MFTRNMRTLRTRKPINYYEPAEPQQDAYEFCDDCNDFVEEYCTVHGGLLVIPDDKVPREPEPGVPRAVLTVPAAFLYIATSSIPGAGLGVFARRTLPRGVRFGPYRGRRLAAPATDYGWQIVGRRAHVIDAGDAARSNWLRYVNCSRHCSEQNLLAYQYHGQIYYRTSENILAGTELLVFYGAEYAAELNINLKLYNKTSTKRIGGTNKMSTQKPNSDLHNASTMNLADSLSSTTRELRRVNAHLTGIPEIDDYFSRSYDDPKQKEIDFLEMLSKLDYLDGSNKKANNNNHIIEEDRDIIEEEENRDSISLTTEDSFTSLDNNNNDYSNANNNSLSIENEPQDDKTEKFPTTWNCEECNETFRSREQLRIHRRQHKCPQKYNCNMCGYKTDVRHLFRRHTLTHENTKPEKPTFSENNIFRISWKCDECELEFKNRDSLRRHRRYHADAQRFKCDKCDYRTDEPFQYERHKRAKHRLPSNVFKCEKCGYSTRDPKGWASHRALHADPRAARCPSCTYLSARRSDVMAHVTRVHVVRPLACGVCGRAFACRQYLRRHVSAMHPVNQTTPDLPNGDSSQKL